MPSERIILIGFMGSGKTTVSALLAAELELPLFELDAEIVTLSGLPSIPEIWKARGEAGFRALESAVCAAAGLRQRGIFSTGGGVVENPDNMVALRGTDGTIVFLRTNLDSILQRVSDPADRPLLQNEARAREIFLRRIPLYLKYADVVVDTDDRLPAEIAQTIRESLR